MPRRADDKFSSEDEFLRAAIRYEPGEGVFYRMLSARPLRIGKPTGGVNSRGYFLVRYCWRTEFKSKLAHRLAFFLMEGVWPSGVMDHLDGDKLNNRWANLMHVTRTENHANTLTRAARTVGRLNGRYYPLIGGGFATMEEAALVAETM